MPRLDARRLVAAIPLLASSLAAGCPLHHRAPGAAEPVPAALSEVMGVVTLGDSSYLVGRGTGEPSGEWLHLQSAPDTWIATTEAADPSLPVGSAWNVGGLACVVDGYDLVVEEYIDTYFDPEGNHTDAPTGPGCGAPALWARLSCPDGGASDLAVPWGRAEAWEATVSQQAAVEERWFELLDTLPAWTDAKASAADQAIADGTESSFNVVVSALQFDTRRLWLVDADVQSGEGHNYCGGSDYFSRLLLVADDEGRVLLQHWRDDTISVAGAYDADRDGIPELRIAAWGVDALQGGPAVGELQLRSVAMCVCGC